MRQAQVLCGKQIVPFFWCVDCWYSGASGSAEVSELVGQLSSRIPTNVALVVGARAAGIRTEPTG